MSITPTTSTEYFWFGTRAVKFEGGTNTGPQIELLDQATDFATRDLTSGTVDFTGSEWQQFLAFSGTAAEMTALGVNVLDGSVDTALTGQVNTTGDLRVGLGVEAYNIADVAGGGRIVDSTGTLDDADDPLAITGLGKAGSSKLDSASIDAADTGNRVIFSNDIGFGFLGGNGFETAGNAVRINDGESVNFEIKQGKQLLQASFTVKVLGGGSTEIVIDSDGATIKDTNGDAQGGFVQDASAGELSLGVLAHGTKVTINYENETIWINGGAFGGDLGDIVSFFDAFQALGSSNLTIGSIVGNQVGWSADDLVLAADVAPTGIPPLPTANGVISFRYTAPGSNTNADLEATLDIGKNGSIDAAETLITSFGGGGQVAGDADGDSNKAELNGTNTPYDILRLVTIGQQDSRAPEGHQTGTLDRSLGIGIDTGAPGASLDDGSSLGGNYGDESGGNHMQNGEFIRFDLGSSFEGVSTQIVFSATDLITRDGEDAVVRLLDSTGGLVDQFAIDLDGGLTHVLSGATVFDQVEIEALANTRFAIADVDIDVYIGASLLPATFTGGGDPTDSLTGGTTGAFTTGPDIRTLTSGNDSANADAGADTVYGGDGADSILGLTNTDLLYGQAGADTIAGHTQVDTIFGGSGNDLISGTNFGEATITQSNDIIVGGYGADTLKGDGGNDSFRYLDAKDTNDVITDWSNDILDFSALYAGTLGFNAVQDDLIAAPNSVSWFQEGGNTLVIVDLNGVPETAELAVTLLGLHTLTAANFVL